MIVFEWLEGQYFMLFFLVLFHISTQYCITVTPDLEISLKLKKNACSLITSWYCSIILGSEIVYNELLWSNTMVLLAQIDSICIP